MEDLRGIENLIKKKAASIHKRTSSGIHESINFKQLHASISNYKEKRPLTGIISIIIEIGEIEHLSVDKVEKLYQSIDDCICQAKNHIKVDRDMNMVESDRIHKENGDMLASIYRELSKDGFCVFVINPAYATTYFLNGDKVGDAIFFTKRDQERFEERKDITELNQLLEDYRVHLTLRDTYQKFFASKSSKSSLFRHLNEGKEISNPRNKTKFKQQEKLFQQQYRNLLENKPEDRFREDLRNFLDKKLKGTVSISKEHILASFRRIDIFITDEYGELYLIEVKWVGISIHHTGTKIGTEFGKADINPEAIKQTIKYIAELHKHKKDIKIGYLVVFDARDGESTDTVEIFDRSLIEEEYSQYYSRHKKIKDFKVVNIHPN